MRNIKYPDLLGITSSVLCLLHCLLIPVVLFFYSTQLQESWHALDYAFILLAGVAVFFSARNTASSAIAKGLWASYAVFSISLLFHEVTPLAFYFSMAGSLSLIVCHLLNLKAHRASHQRSYSNAQ